MLIHTDSFESYTNLAERYPNFNIGGVAIIGTGGGASVQNTNSNTGANCLMISAGTNFAGKKYVGPALTTLVCGAYVKAGYNISPFISLYDSAGTCIGGIWAVGTNLYYATTAVSDPGSGTILGALPGGVNVHDGQYHHFEVKFAYVSGNNWTLSARCDGTALSSSATLALGASGIINIVGIADNTVFNYYNTGNISYMDDVYICNGVAATHGPANNDFLGPVVIKYVPVSGAGSSTSFTPSAGSNYACVQDAPSDDDTTYIQSSTVGARDSYSQAGTLSGVASVFGVNVLVNAKKLDGNSGTINASLHIGGVDYDNSIVALPALNNYQVFDQLWDYNPATNAAFTLADVNAAGMGVRVAS